MAPLMDSTSSPEGRAGSPHARAVPKAATGLQGCRQGASGGLDTALAGAIAITQSVPMPTGTDPLAEAGGLQEALEAMDARVAAVRGAL